MDEVQYWTPTGSQETQFLVGVGNAHEWVNSKKQNAVLRNYTYGINAIGV